MSTRRRRTRPRTGGPGRRSPGSPAGWRTAAGLVLAAEALARGGASPACADVIISGHSFSSINLDSPPPQFVVRPRGRPVAEVEFGATVLVNSGTAVFGPQRPWDVTNNGMLQSMGGVGFNLTKGGSLITTGIIRGRTLGVQFERDGTVDNAGLIEATVGMGILLERGGSVENDLGGMIIGLTAGVLYENRSASLINAGDIAAGAGTGVHLEQGGSVENDAGGVIRGTTAGVLFENGDGSLSNAGLIEATAIGARLEQGGSVGNAGTIRGISAGLQVENGDASLTNTGLIEATAGIGINVERGGTVQNLEGTIRGTTEGIHLVNGDVSLTNTGVIEATAGDGVSARTGRVTIVNTFDGSIRGAGSAAGVLLSSGGTVTNAGSILAGTSGIALDSRDGGTLSNTGSIGGGVTGVHLRNNPASVTNHASGIITGTGLGLSIERVAGTVINAGEITGSGPAGVGIQLLDGGTITNSGDISGGGIGVSITSGGTVTNTGSISGGTNSVVFASRNGALILDSGSRLAGTADGGGSSTTTLLGAGTAANDFIRFDRLSMEGSVWTIAGQRAEFNEASVRSGVLVLAGNLTSAQATIDPGALPGASAAAILAGHAPVWTNSGNFTVGDQGAGSLTIGAGGRVHTSTVLIADRAGSTGNLTIGAAPGLPPADPGLLEATTVQFGAGTGSITFNHSALEFFMKEGTNYTFDAALRGNGALNVVAGTTELTADSSAFAGATTVSGGRLLVSGVLGGTGVVVGSGATLGGTGSILGSVSIADGGSLAPGLSPGTLTIAGNLSLSNASILAYELGPAGAIGGGLNDLTRVLGDLRLDGVLNITDAGGFGAGVYRLFDYGGTLTDNGLALGTLPPNISPGNIQVQTSVAHQVNLVQTSGQSLSFWDGPTAPGNGVIDGGDGVWNNANSNWTDMNGIPSGPWSGEFAVFAGQAGTVTVQGTVGLTGMQLETDGYLVVPGTAGVLTISEPQTTIRVDQGVTAEIAAPIQGSGGLEKRDLGTLILSGANSYTGGTVIDAGTISISSDASLGAASGALTLNGGILRTTATFTEPRSISLGARGGDFHTDPSTMLTLTGAIGGAGDLVKSGAGTLVLAAANAYTGNTFVAGGTLIGDAASIRGDLHNTGVTVFSQMSDATFAGAVRGTGMGDGTVVKAGPATLTLGGLSTLNWAIEQGELVSAAERFQGDVAVNAGTMRFDQAADAQYAGTISGVGQLVKTGAGVLSLTADNTFTGLTTIGAGTLMLGAGGATGSIAGNITNNGVLALNHSGHVTLPGVISGPGSLQQVGAGRAILTGENTYTGGTTISSGTLQIGDAGITGSLPGNVTNNSLLVFDRSNTITYPGVVSGTGSLIQAGTGTLVLTGENTHAGPTDVVAGTLQIGDGGTTGSVAGDIDNLAALVFNRSDTPVYAGVVSGHGSLTQAGAGTLILTGTSTHTGGTIISAGTLQIGNGGTTGSVDGNITDRTALVFNRTDTSTYHGVVSGPGSVTQAGAGTLIFSENQTYTGGTTISAGTLQLGNGGVNGSVSGDVTDNAALVFNHASPLNFRGVIGGTGTVAKDGPGTLLLSGDNTYTGGTLLNSGTLLLTRDSSLGAPPSPLAFAGGVLQLASSFDVAPSRAITLNAPGGVIDTRLNSTTLAQAITGAGGLTKRGEGTLRLTGASTYTGPTAVDAGTLQVNGSIISPVTMAPDTRLMGNGSVGATTNSGVIAPGNSIGTLTINGDYSHQPGSNYEAEGEPGGTSDLIRVNGAVALSGGTLTLHPEPGLYGAVLRYLILDSTGGVTGTFAGPGFQAAFFNVVTEYQPNQVFVVLEPLPFNNPGVAISYNTSSVETALGQIAPTANGEILDMLQQLETLDVDAAITSLNSLTGDLHPTLASLMLQGHALLGQAVTRRLADRSSGESFALHAPSAMMPPSPALEPAPDERLSDIMTLGLLNDAPPDPANDFWARIYGVLAGDREADGNGPGAGYNTGGAAVGYDRRLGEHLVLGVSADYSFTRVDFDRDSGRADVHAYDAALYAGYSAGATYVDAVFAYGYLDNNTQRAVTAGDIFHTAEAQYPGHRFAGYLEAGHRFTIGDKWQLKPLASIQYTWLRQMDFTESGAGDLGLTTDAFETQSFRTGLGARASTTFEWRGAHLTPELRVRWFHECLDQFASYDPAFIGAQGVPFNIRGTSADRDSVALGAGIELARRGNFACFIDYDVRFSSEEVANYLTLGARFEW